MSQATITVTDDESERGMRCTLNIEIPDIDRDGWLETIRSREPAAIRQFFDSLSDEQRELALTTLNDTYLESVKGVIFEDLVRYAITGPSYWADFFDDALVRDLRGCAVTNVLYENARRLIDPQIDDKIAATVAANQLTAGQLLQYVEQVGGDNPKLFAALSQDDQNTMLAEVNRQPKYEDLPTTAKPRATTPDSARGLATAICARPAKACTRGGAPGRSLTQLHGTLRV